MQFSDFTSEGLARLEAKLLADVEVVRRMRALLEEHKAVWEGRGGPVAGNPQPVPVPMAPAALPVVLRPPRREPEELAIEWLGAREEDTFLTADLRWGLRKQGMNPDENTIKTLMNRLQRTGKVAVQEKRFGRGGSLFRRLFPRVPPANPEVAGPEMPPQPAAEGSAAAIS